MNFPFLIAKRYFISKKKQNIINIISGVAVTGVAITTMALITILSVFNGLDSLVKSMFSSFDPSIKITAVEGKTFDPLLIDKESVTTLKGVASWAETLEENAILLYNNKQDIAIVKGVSDDYIHVTDLDKHLIHGELFFKNNGLNYAVFGAGVAMRLGVGLSFVQPIDIYAAKKGERMSANISRALNHKYVYPAATFSIQESIDSKYVLVPLDFARELFDTPNNVSAIEIKLENGVDINATRNAIQNIIGSAFHVKNQYEQHETIYRVMNSEKWAIFLILSFILLIASFNILGSLSMLIIDKKEDIMILKSMGAEQSSVKQIFLIEGWLISLTGAVLGLVLGILVCWVQQSFGLVKLAGGGSFAVSAYPVEIHFFDVILSFVVVLLIGFLISWYPIRYISGKYMDESSH